jgi:hypothetical protein
VALGTSTIFSVRKLLFRIRSALAGPDSRVHVTVNKELPLSFPGCPLSLDALAHSHTVFGKLPMAVRYLGSRTRFDSRRPRVRPKCLTEVLVTVVGAEGAGDP